MSPPCEQGCKSQPGGGGRKSGQLGTSARRCWGERRGARPASPSCLFLSHAAILAHPQPGKPPLNLSCGRSPGFSCPTCCWRLAACAAVRSQPNLFQAGLFHPFWQVASARAGRAHSPHLGQGFGDTFRSSPCPASSRSAPLQTPHHFLSPIQLRPMASCRPPCHQPGWSH